MPGGGGAESQHYFYKLCGSSMNYIFMFIILKTDFFQLWFLCKSDLCIFTAGKKGEIIEQNTFKTVEITLLIR